MQTESTLLQSCVYKLNVLRNQDGAESKQNITLPDIPLDWSLSGDIREFPVLSILLKPTSVPVQNPQ